MPAANLDYFLGTWSFEWTIPDSPLGPGGKIVGSETFKKLESPERLARIDGFPDIQPRSLPPALAGGSLYESTTTADAPSGPLRVRAITSYNAPAKTVTRHEVDSRGFSTTKTGPIGGDLGGYYSIFWNSTPIATPGASVTLRGRTLMYSPVHYRIEYKISVDGGPYTDYGRPWFKKTDPAKPTP